MKKFQGSQQKRHCQFYRGNCFYFCARWEVSDFTQASISPIYFGNKFEVWKIGRNYLTYSVQVAGPTFPARVNPGLGFLSDLKSLFPLRVITPFSSHRPDSAHCSAIRASSEAFLPAEMQSQACNFGSSAVGGAAIGV